jgi:hypothetical protein
MCSGSQLVSLAQGTFPDTITTTATATGADGTAVTRVVAREITLLAPMFQLNYQSSDLATSSSSTSSAGSAETTRTESIASTTNPASSDSTSSPATGGQGGLSTGAIAGIGVGAALGGIVLGILAILLFLRHRKRKREMEVQAFGVDPNQWVGGPQPGVKYYYEADTTVVAEMPVQNHFYPGIGPHPVEMPTGPDRLSHFHDSERRN